MSTITATITSTGMNDRAALYRLLTWLSPAFPTGGFAYSHGLETAIAEGRVRDADTAREWLADILAHGGGFSDAVLLARAHEAADDGAALHQVAEFAAAFQPSAEIRLESVKQGEAFLATARAAWPCAALEQLIEAWPDPHAYPVTVAVCAAGHGIACDTALPAYLHAFMSNLVSAAIRLVPLGQSDGQRIVAALEPVISATAQRAAATPLDELGTAAFISDIMSMRHETQETRIFRS